MIRFISVLAIDYCKEQPCKNGSCLNIPAGFLCKCGSDYTGNLCETGICCFVYDHNAFMIFLNFKV